MPDEDRGWALLPLVSELRIKTKDLQLVRFGDVMNYAQRDLIAECERQLNETGRIRVVVLKARQMGLSTAIEAILFTLAFAVPYFRVLIVSHAMDSSQHILTMCDTYWKTSPWRGLRTTRYAGRKELAWAETGSGIRVDTAGGKGVGRSQTINALHASEVAFWPDPDELVNGLRQAIPNHGVSAIFYESTANGVGNFFHRAWRESSSGRNEFVAKFYPWWRHPEYTIDYITPGEAAKFGLEEGSLTTEERQLRAMGVDDGRLVWRRWAVRNLCGGNLERFHQEYPSTSAEAFTSTGRNVYPLDLIRAHYEPMVGERGRLAVLGGQIKFVRCGEFEGGVLRVFGRPSPDTDWGKYLIGADPSHTHAGDYACAQVINRRTSEQVAVYRRKCDPITFAQDLALLGRWFNDALIATEKEGPGYATVGHLEGQQYPNQWMSEKLDTVRGRGMGPYGWSTNVQTKHLAVQTLLKCIVEDLVTTHRPGGERQTWGLLLHDDMTANEMKDYVSSPKGSGYENSDGSEYDDGVMALAIAVTVNQIEPAPPAFGIGGAPRVRLVDTEEGPKVEEVGGDGERPPWEGWGEETG